MTVKQEIPASPSSRFGVLALVYTFILLVQNYIIRTFKGREKLDLLLKLLRVNPLLLTLGIMWPYGKPRYYHS